jgi:hypothetical protein
VIEAAFSFKLEGNMCRILRLGGLEAWRHIVQYEAGRWEDLVLPMLELAEFFTGYFSSLGSIGGKVNTITVVGQHYQETGTLQLPDDD